MPEETVKFTVKIEEEPDPGHLQKLVEEAVQKYIADQQDEVIDNTAPEVPEVTTEPETETEDVLDSGGNVVGGRTVGGGGLISEYGYGHEPRKYYPQRRRRYQLPETGNAPFSIDDGTIQGFGGSAYLSPRGFQQEKVNRRGNIRKNESLDRTPIAGINPPSVKQQLRDMRKMLSEDGEFADMVSDKINDAMGKFGKGAEAFLSPKDFVVDTFMEVLGTAGPKGKAIAIGIGAIMVSAAVLPTIIRALSRKGMPWNNDWHRNIETEAMAGLQNLDEQARRFVGLDSFVIAQTAGYKPIDGTDVYTSMEDRDEDRIARIGPGLKAWGTV